MGLDLAAGKRKDERAECASIGLGALAADFDGAFLFGGVVAERRGRLVAIHDRDCMITISCSPC